MKITKTIFLLLFIVCTSPLLSQVLKGRILNEDGRQPVPFAVVAIDKSNRGTTADLDGNFELPLNGSEKEITVQVLGYQKKTIDLATINLTQLLLVKLKADNISLMEIVITPKENPADILIRKVIRNKPKYDINNLKYYFCTTYAKTYFTLADKNGDEAFYNKDTIKYKKLKAFLEKSYFFFMESVTEKKYVYKNKSQEKVLSSRVSGFKSAPFGAFASQLQSFTFYKDNIELLGVKYLSPVIPGTLKRYRFEISDTVYSGKDTTILIKFSPRKNVKFKALKGVLYINKNDYALCNVLAEPAEAEKDGTGIRIQQLYEKVDSATWFPRQANTEILFTNVNGSSGESGSGGILKGVSRMYIKDIKLDSAVKIHNKSVEVYNAEDYADKNENFWNKYRTDSLDKRELRTYEMVDSVGNAMKLDQKLKWLTALTTGKWQIGYFDIDLKHILRFNGYEGTRLGLGLSTSNKLSRWVSVGAYGGYGFKDKAFKYGGNVQINFNYPQTTFLLGEAASEVVESAGTTFLNENYSFISTQKIRDILVSQMDKVNYAKVSFNTSILNTIKTSVYMQVQQRVSPFGYYTAVDVPEQLAINKYTLNEAGIQLRYWPKEKFIESMGRLISSGSKWPIFSVNVVKGLTDQIDVYKGDFDYTKIDLRIDHQLNFKVKGFLAYQLQAGKVFGNVPYSVQYNNKGSKTQVLSVSAEKTFETMYLNEFISTEYAAMFVSLNFGRMFAPNKKFNPELELMHNYGIGNLSNREQLTQTELNDISKGYTEAGIRIKNIVRSNFSTFGLGVFYRYGNYAYEKTEQNFTYKLVLGLSF